ncbi:PIN/TRAM domain-containing protein [Geomicrobium sp. JCM 19039]|uniref:PIN/TRAM domain-containing protein n=1 Tax=Geomicrobium sp. JCM 19039 TaxID=1460636 RepID=UPI00045F120B|nr:PIN/TRAM domain-containing protein [Geomicrobium sp. JCM 19039]GAK13860.1 pili retraction protein PilT [Geomicrobium sp. JCM 19039]
MLKRIVQVFFVILGGALGFIFYPELISLLSVEIPGWMASDYIGGLLGGGLFFVLSLWLADPITRALSIAEEAIVKAPITNVLFGTIGLLLGLMVAYLIGIPLGEISFSVFSQILPIFLTVLFGYFGYRIGSQKRDELISLVSNFGKGSNKDFKQESSSDKGVPTKIFDTSVIIDGRIADVCRTRFLEGTVVIPKFVLDELQHIADSSDALKRNRGRRGLDILNQIQKELPVQVKIEDIDFDDVQGVDSKLVKLAQKTSGIVVTNDFNLNKVCDLQGVPVLNINDLANAVKPVVLPGEEMHVQVIKDGKEANQGIGYLDDGTMIVIEEGHKYIGQQIDVVVTSVLQTSAGRMIFAKPKQMHKEKAL